MKRLLTILLALSLLAPAGALADDESVKAAWDGDDRAYVRLSKKHVREVRAFGRRGFERPAPLLDNLRRTLRVQRHTTRAVRGEEPSTEGGERAKRLALLALRDLGGQIRAEMRGVRLLAKGRRAKGNRWLAKSDRLNKRGAKFAKRGRRAFLEAGVEG